ncbi:MAG: DNA-binding protein [Candidatus Omnitrophota bacterium]
MRSKIILSALFLAFLALFCPRVVCAQEVSSQELINCALEYDGKEVVYVGELIGAVLKRGSFVWLNLSDEKNVIGIWASRDLSPSVAVAGSYTHRGDIVKVKGIFHRSCAEHGGALDIHAQELTVIELGTAVTHPIEQYKIIALLGLLGVLICLLTAHILLKHFRKS